MLNLTLAQFILYSSLPTELESIIEVAAPALKQIGETNDEVKIMKASEVRENLGQTGLPDISSLFGNLRPGKKVSK